jgi:inosine-uridine nucleoside N-ribohydrolase
MIKPKAFQLLGITTVFGNVSAKQSAANFCRVFDMFPNTIAAAAETLQCDIYVGCERPIVGDLPQSWPGHGSDGMGDAIFEPHQEWFGPSATVSTSTSTSTSDSHSHSNSTKTKISSEHGCMAMHRLIQESKSPVDLMLLGPCTNLAMVLRLFPDDINNIANVYIMGGSLNSHGNSSAAAEFNFHSDPEAARIVFDSFDEPRIHLITWELTELAALNWKQFDDLVHLGTKEARLLAATCRAYESMCRPKPTPARVSHSTDSTSDSKSKANAKAHQQYPNATLLQLDASNSFIVCDAIAAIVYVWPHIVNSIRELSCTIDTGSEQSRGAVITSWYHHTNPKPGRHNVVLVQDIDFSKFMQCFRWCYSRSLE